jgi:hypothetical protein
MIKRSTLGFVIMTHFVLSDIGYSTAAEKDNRFTTALKLVEMTFNKGAVYQQFIGLSSGHSTIMK